MAFHICLTGNDDNSDYNSNMDTTTNTGYTATRTATDTGYGMTNTAWIWLIVGIVGIMIVALVWYYVAQDTGTRQ